MRNKFLTLSKQSFYIAFGLFIVCYIMFHHLTPNLTLTTAFLIEPSKPFISELVGNLGVLFLFSGIANKMIANIFFPKTNEPQGDVL